MRVHVCACVCVCVCACVCVCKNTEGHWGLYIWIYEQNWVFYDKGHSKTLVIFVVYVRIYDNSQDIADILLCVNADIFLNK